MSDIGASEEYPPRQPPSIQRQRQGRHPFQERNRNHFPGLDQILGSSDLKPRFSTFQPLFQQQRQDMSSASNRSVCSSQNVSLMDMSIGARASMTEHLRHIAKFGFDDSPNLHLEDQQHQHQQQKHPNDDEWNQLLDGISWTGADDSFVNMAPILTFHDERCDSIEVTADVSSDFFNSSRIYQLSTPEKNKNRTQAVTTRSRDVSQYVESDSGSAHDSEGSTMMHMFKAAMNLNVSEVVADDRESSFVSFSGVDVSRISGVNDSFADTRRSPDRSGDFFHPFGMSTPSGPGRTDISFSTPGSSDHQPLPSMTFLSPASSFFMSPQKSHFHKRVGGSDNINTLLLSPIAAKAGYIAGKMLRGPPGESMFKSTDRFPDLASDGGAIALESLGIEDIQDQTPSQTANVSEIDIQIHSIARLENSAMSDGNDFCSSSHKNSIGGGFGYQAGSSSSNSVGPHHSPMDRRRFRTVVPHRVFIDEPSDFPEQADDSFSVPSSNTGTTTSMDESNVPLRWTSLLESFDEVAGGRSRQGVNGRTERRVKSSLRI